MSNFKENKENTGKLENIASEKAKESQEIKKQLKRMQNSRLLKQS